MSLVLTMVLAATSLRVEAGGDLPCELGTRLAAALAEQKLEVDDRAEHRLIVVRVKDDVVVRLVDRAGIELGWRSLKPSAKDCAVVPKTVALLARTWLKTTPPATPSPPAGERAGVRGQLSEPEEKKRFEPRPVEPETPRVPEAARPITPQPLPLTPTLFPTRGEGAPVSIDAGDIDAGVIDAGVIDAGVIDAGVVDAGVIDAGTPGPPRSMSLSIAVAGGASLDLVRPVAQLTAFADWGFSGAWGATLDLGLDSNRTASDGAATLEVQSYWVGLAARRQLIWNLYATLGARLFLYNAIARNVTTPDTTLLFGGAAYAALDWRQPVLDTLFLLARIGGQLRFRGESLAIPGANADVYLHPWSFFAQAGVGLKL
ncbi:MAG: hypothetical protein JNK82_19415 [Myxococcaceae bacterium]|nr:hypothetical protein [Myxococcaceae bacterium]